MHWFGGSIAEAVTLSKQKNAIFVVFVEGENDLTVEMSATLDDREVSKRLSDQSKFLVIKLKSDSPSYMHFAQIYQFVPVPSLFFIGRNGMPLEVVCAGVEASSLASRIDRILEEQHKLESTIQPSTSSQSIKEQTASLIRSEADQLESRNATKRTVMEGKDVPVVLPKTQKTEVATPQEYEIICDGDVCVRRPKDKSQEAGPSSRQDTLAYNMEVDIQKAKEEGDSINITTEDNIESKKNDKAATLGGSTASLEERTRLAQELIEAKRIEKAEKEKEEEKRKELERRKIGKGVGNLKKWQAEQEMKNLQEERKREKLENEAARQKILQQIAQDRAERKARDSVPVAQAAPAQSAPMEQPTSGDSTATRARIQFKLPDGGSHSAGFGADTTLAELAQYVADNWQMQTSSFTLWTAFPRRQLTDMDATVAEMSLTPSAALLVMPRRGNGAAVARPTSVANFITLISQLLSSFILEPSRQIYSWLAARLWPQTPSPRPARPADPVVATLRPAAGARRRGNVHRLSEGRPSDDDNNTWNGNSTQQM